MKIHAARECLRPTQWVFIAALALSFAFGCNKVRQTNMTPLDAAGMHPDTVEQLHKYQVTDGEVQQVLIAGKAGMTERGCLNLVEIARSRHRSFAEGELIAQLLEAGMMEGAVIQLVRMDQLGLFAGEAAAMRLAGLSDDLILNVARHRTKGQPVLAGARLAELRDAGFSNAQLIEAVNRGLTDKQAQDIIARHNYAVGGHSFVRQHGRRR